jgi:hypothetical protein
MREKYSPSALVAGKNLSPAVLHFCGKKAHVFSFSAKVAAMNHFRLRYLTEVENFSRYQAYKIMAKEDMLYVFRPKAKKAYAKMQRLVRKAFIGCNREKQV